jgi:MFS-type transporter involved in bile tolerance (Atg22 family)
MNWKDFYSKLSEFSPVVLAILSKWYYLIAIPALIITFNVVKAVDKIFTERGVYATLKHNLDELEYLSTECPQRLYNLKSFLSCLKRSKKL